MVKEIEATVLASGCVKLTVNVSLPETLAAVLLNAGSAAETVTTSSEHSMLMVSIHDNNLLDSFFILFLLFYCIKH